MNHRAIFSFDPCFYGPSTIKAEPLLLRPQIKEKGLRCCQLMFSCFLYIRISFSCHIGIAQALYATRYYEYY